MQRTARDVWIRIAEACEEYEDWLNDPEKLKLLGKQAELLSDDTTVKPCVQNMCRAFLRGFQKGKSGKSPGQIVDEEIERWRKEERENAG